MKIRVESLTCRNCDHPLTGFEDDLFWACENCGATWRWSEEGLKREPFLIPSPPSSRDGLFYLPFYLFRFRDNDFYLPAYRMGLVTPKMNLSYAFSIERKEHLSFEKASFGRGVRVPAEAMLPLLQAYILLFYDKEITSDEAARMQYRICGMPCILEGEEIKDLVWGYRMSAHCVERLDGYFRLKKD